MRIFSILKKVFLKNRNFNKNLFIISSPLQLINIQELIYVKKWDNNFIVALYISENEKAHIKKTAQTLGVNNIEFIKRKKILAYISIIKVGFKFKRVKNFILGHLIDNHHLLLNNIVKKKNSFLVDDGMATNSSYKLYSKNIYPKQIKKFLKYPKNLHFFSIYDLGSTSIKIIKNKYINLKRYYSSKRSSDHVYFIGARIYNDIGEKEHIRILQEVSKQNPDIIYFPHRKETPSFLRELKKSGIKISENNLAFELMIINSEILPKKILGFVSSTYNNLIIINKLLFSKKLNLFFIPLIDYPFRTKKQQDFYKSHYTHLINLGINEYKIN